MIVDYISDFHVDFYLSYDNYDIDNLKTTILHDIFSKKTGEVYYPKMSRQLFIKSNSLHHL
jgi:uncharacterized protein Smg (DUF494 family)